MCFTTLVFLAHHQLPVESRDHHQSPPLRRHDTSLYDKQLLFHKQYQSPTQAKKDDMFLGTDTRDFMVAGKTGTSGQKYCQNILFAGEHSHG